MRGSEEAFHGRQEGICLTGVDGHLRSVEAEKRDRGESKKCEFYPVGKNSRYLRKVMVSSKRRLWKPVLSS